MDYLNVKIMESKDIDLIFKFMDMDDSKTIEYKEFIKKLKRQGLIVRDKNEDQIYTLYKLIYKNGLSLR